jgi:hypothetical protein
MSSVLEGQCEHPGCVCLTGEAFRSTTAVSTDRITTQMHDHPYEY